MLNVCKVLSVCSVLGLSCSIALVLLVFSASDISNAQVCKLFLCSFLTCVHGVFSALMVFRALNALVSLMSFSFCAF